MWDDFVEVLNSICDKNKEEIEHPNSFICAKDVRDGVKDSYLNNKQIKKRNRRLTRIQDKILKKASKHLNYCEIMFFPWDRIIAKDIYSILEAKGYRVFFTDSIVVSIGISW